MSRPYPDRRRKRPRSRLPDRYRHERPAVRPASFLDFGLRHIYGEAPEAVEAAKTYFREQVEALVREAWAAEAPKTLARQHLADRL